MLNDNSAERIDREAMSGDKEEMTAYTSAEPSDIEVITIYIDAE
jgi:hypothetical protein